MNVISTTLKLVCCPLTTNDFSWAKKDSEIQSAIKNAHVYMIAKKSQIRFSNIEFDGDKIDLNLINAYGLVRVSIPVDQPIFKPHNKKKLVLEVVSDGENILVDDSFAAETSEISFYQIDHSLYETCLAKGKDLKKHLDENFVIRLTPEKLLYLYLNEKIRIPDSDITGSFLWNYDVVCVNKVKNWKEQKDKDGCESLLDALQSEVDGCGNIRDDVVLLFFNAQERDNSLLIANATSFNDFQKLFCWEKMPSVELLSLKTEKPFESKSRENTITQYDVADYAKNDNVNLSQYDVVDYTINDNINLIFKDMKWLGGKFGNCLVYCKDSNLSVMNPTNFNDLLEKKFMESVLSY